MKAELENCAPGPGSYDPPINNKDKKDFNTSTVTSNFHSPVAQVPVQHKWRSPAPNAYQVCKPIGIGVRVWFNFGWVRL